MGFSSRGRRAGIKGGRRDGVVAKLWGSSMARKCNVKDVPWRPRPRREAECNWKIIFVPSLSSCFSFSRILSAPQYVIPFLFSFSLGCCCCCCHPLLPLCFFWQLSLRFFWVSEMEKKIIWWFHKVAAYRAAGGVGGKVSLCVSVCVCVIKLQTSPL